MSSVDTTVAANPQRHWHVLARYLALASRPALIWLLIRTANADAAAEIGKLIISAAIVSIFLGNEAHLEYYRAEFSHYRGWTTQRYRKLQEYLRSFVTHCTLILPLSLALSYLLFPSVNPIALTVLALAERISDECLRIVLYQKRWSEWTGRLLAKHFIPFGMTFLLTVVAPSWVPTAYILASCVVATALVAVSDSTARRALFCVIREPMLPGQLRGYVARYGQHLALRQIAAVLAANILLIDRLVGMNFWTAHQTANVILVGQIVSGVFFITDAKYLAQYRAEFINPDLAFKDFWRWRSYLVVIAGCTLVSLGIVFIGRNTGLLASLSELNDLAILTLIINAGIYFGSVPLNDFVYYRGLTRSLAAVHVGLVLAFLTVALSFASMTTPTMLIGLSFVLLLIRALSLRGLLSMLERETAGRGCRV